MVYDNESNQEKNIRGKALYFGTSQVADILGIPDSKVRYYTNVFDDILHIEISNKQRRYTQIDIDKMKFIIELKDEGMTLKQIQEYCQEVDFENSKEIQIKENNPLSIQAIAKALLEQQATLINSMKQDVIEELSNRIDRRLDLQDERFEIIKSDLSAEVAITVEDTINKVTQEFSENIHEEIDNNFNNMSDKIINENKKDIESIKENNNEHFKKMESSFRCITQEELKKYTEQQNQPQGLFSGLVKLFNKKK